MSGAGGAMLARAARVLDAELGGRWAVQPLGVSFAGPTGRARGVGRDGSRTALFLKCAPAAHAEVLRAEADGLAALAHAGAVRTPEVVGCWTGAPADGAVLALEWLDLAAAPAAAFGERFGRALGALHAAAPPAGDGRFGWPRDNWLGGTPQRNRWSAQGGRDGWIAFFAQERLGALAARLAAMGGHDELVRGVDRIVAALPRCFDDGHRPRPSLVHGDLWSGNWGSLGDGTPVVFDPAVSVSDAEAELAMMELFGAPPPTFWDAYREVAGLAHGYARRRRLYQLHHLLNHALLFGAGYARQALTSINDLLEST